MTFSGNYPRNVSPVHLGTEQSASATITSTGQTILSAATMELASVGALVMNEGTIDGRIGSSSSEAFFLLPKRTNDITTPIPMLGQGPIFVKSTGADIAVSWKWI
jgi:hypothetical protein